MIPSSHFTLKLFITLFFFCVREGSNKAYCICSVVSVDLQQV